MTRKLRGGERTKQELHHMSRGRPGNRVQSDDAVARAVFPDELHAPFGDEAA